jgi:hypothetical protein
MAGEMEVRSWRRVYRLERRVYAIPNGQGEWRIPVPGGIPIWGAAYFIAAIALVFLARNIPGIDLLAGAVPPEIAFTLIPAAGAYVGARYRPHGRMPHRHWTSLISEHFAGKHFYGEERLPRAGIAEVLDETVTLAPGPDWPILLDGEITGPATVYTRDPVALRYRHRRHEITPLHEDDPSGVAMVRVEAGERLRVRGGQR